MKRIFLVLLICAVAVGGYMGYRWYQDRLHKKVVDSGQALIVNVQKVMPSTQTIKKTYVGYVRPINSVNVYSYIPGFVDQVLVQGGQEVKMGDLLFVLQQDEYKAQNELAAAKVVQAQATMENAKIYYNRMQEAGKRAVSKTDLDNARTSFLSAEASVAESKANAELAEVNYNYTTIHATLPGIVGDVQITKGDYVGPSTGTPLVNIIQYTPIRAVFAISNKEYLQELISGNPLMNDWNVRLRLADGQIYKKGGRIQFLNNEVTPSTSSITVYADFDNTDKELVANAYVDVLLEKTIKDGIFIAQNLVNFVPEGAVIYTVGTDNMIHKTPVVVGTSVGDLFYIKSGLQPDDLIVLDKISPYDLMRKVQVKDQSQ